MTRRHCTALMLAAGTILKAHAPAAVADAFVATRLGGQAMAVDDGVERVRAAVAIEFPRESHCTERGLGKREVQAPELGLQERVIEPGIMRHQHAVLQHFHERSGNRCEGRSVPHHGIGDAGKRLNLWWNRHSRVDEGMPLAGQRTVIDQQQPDLADTIPTRRDARRFEIKDGEARCKQGISRCDGWRCRQAY